MDQYRRVFLATLPALAATVRGIASEGYGPTVDYGPTNADLTLVVRDPLAAPLACACVEGFAQRKYEKVANYLKKATGKSIRVKWSDSLANTMESESFVPAIVIGKDSVIRAESHRLRRLMYPVAKLTDQTGSTTQTGYFVVRGNNSASTLLDLDNYTIWFGPESSDEKHLAAYAKLRDADITFQVGETCETCSVAAKKLTEISDSDKTAAVISSYAERLLVGCGNVKKGELKVVGQTDEVPFVSVFVDSTVPKDVRMAVQTALLKLSSDKELLEALQSQNGFVTYAS